MVSEKMGLSFYRRRPVHNTNFWKNVFLSIIYCGEAVPLIFIIFSGFVCCLHYAQIIKCTAAIQVTETMPTIL